MILVAAAAMTFAFLFKNKIVDGIDENWEKDKYRDTRRKIEKEFQCCGFSQPKLLDCGAFNGTKAYFPTCEKRIKDEVNRQIKILEICTIIMAAIEIILFICACYLACCHHEEYEIK